MDKADASLGHLHPLVVALIARSLQRLAPGLVADSYDFQALLGQDAVPAIQKLALLDAAFARGGGQLVLRIGGVLHDPGLPPQPVLLLLKNTASVRELLAKCEQLWPTLNTRNRVVTRELGAHHAVIEHVIVGGGYPTVRESLHICGLAIAMLEFLGCRGVEVHLVHDDVRSSLVYAEERYFEPASGPAHRWAFRWRAFVPRDRLEGLDEYLHATARFRPLDDPEGLHRRLLRLVRGAPARRWTLATCARELATSARSLQRALAASQTTFTAALWDTRVALAEELLVDTSASATEVALALGFSDSAHFSRRFARASGVSPAEFRRRRQ